MPESDIVTDINGKVGSAMASLVVRNLDDAIKEALVARARDNGRSMEAEVRAILIDVVQPKNIGIALYEARRDAAVELETPPRDDEARAVLFK